MPWIPIAKADQLQDDEVLAVNTGALKLALYRSQGDYFVTDNVCTHQYALLSDGYLEDGCIECPLHQARFHIPTGEVRAPPATENLRVYPVKVENGTIFVDVATSSAPST